MDTKHQFTIHDDQLRSDSDPEGVFDFLEKYNFTIAEDSPLDKEVAVDPEMIGKVYESLVNLSTEADERGDAGIFYTPRTEIDLMCRLSLVDNMANRFDNKYKNTLYEVIFALEPDERESADAEMAKAGLWGDFNKHLRDIKILDPACGSGSFLVGMLHILDDLLRRAETQIEGKEPNPAQNFERKKQIIGQCLYGVDVMKWACHVAELRLWLALIVDAEIKQEKLAVRKEPLLPHFSFKIRQGDSLVQEVAGINLGHMRNGQELSSAIKTKITKLKNEKLKFYNHEGSRFHRIEDAEAEELLLFREILETRGSNISNEIKQLKSNIRNIGQPDMFEKGEPKLSKIMKEKITQWEQQIESYKSEQEYLLQARKALRTSKNLPFVWDIAFVEIFSSEDRGFDVVIGNPPYVRQENIAKPGESRETITVEKKKAYKAKLARSVYQSFHNYFGYKVHTDRAVRKLNAKSDLYIYFYFHGLSLLNSKGTFCFITSNSWLDVGYGSDLQEFLLQRCHAKMIIDNQEKRSFESADVNTIITLFSAPGPAFADPQPHMEKSVTRFVMFKVPFEHTLSAILFEEIEEAGERKTTEEYRLFPISQDKLYTDGLEWPEEETGDRRKRSSLSSATYIGNKWGGKYLRAPDIYWTILEKGKGKLVRLGDVAEVRFGIKTGANEFFYLDAAKIAEWEIEKEFLKPVIKSPRECKRILIDPKDLKYKIFMCHKEKKQLRGTAALEYIKWGEKQGFHERPSCAGRARWWDLGERRIPPIISPCGVSELMRTFKNDSVLADKRLYEIYPANANAVLLFTNSTVFSMFCEIGSRTGLGEGLLDLTVYELANCFVLIIEDTESLNKALRRYLYHEQLPLSEELSHSDRRLLDGVVFDALNLTPSEREAVYDGAIQLVKSRLSKADSFKAKNRQA